MEPLNDKELNELLQRWNAPGAPASLRQKLSPASRPWWRWLLTGSIRIPVPVGLVAVAILAVWMFLETAPPATVEQPAESNSLADFQPVQQLEPRIIRANLWEQHENQGQESK